MKRVISLILASVLVMESAVMAGLGKNKAMYVGGTLSNMPEKCEGIISTKDEQVVVFSPDKKYKGVEPLRITYNDITGLEYGQKAGRRVGVAILVSPLALFSKKRKHYLTVTYNDDSGKEQAAVFELGKEIVRTTLTVLEVRSGKEVEYQDEEARKTGKGN